jgi:flagellar biosynthesis protein FlhG
MNDQAQKLREYAGAGMFGAVAVQPALPEAAAGCPRPRCTSIAVTSGKGGVGKTNIALFIAVALARMKKRVLVLDADLGLANVHILLGSAPRKNLSHVVSGACSVRDAVYRGPGGIDVLPGAAGMEAMANLDRASVGNLQRMLAVFEQEYDFLIIDTAAGIGSSVTSFASQADLSLLVLTPEPTSLADAYATAKVLFEHGARRIATVVNMTVADREGAETFDRLNTLVVKFLKKGVMLYGTLPFDREVPRCVRKQQVLVLEDPGSRFSEKIQSVAWKLSGMSPARHDGFFSRLWKKMLPVGGNSVQRN